MAFLMQYDVLLNGIILNAKNSSLFQTDEPHDVTLGLHLSSYSLLTNLHHSFAIVHFSFSNT